VRLLRRADASAEEVLDSDLVIDATGRGSRSPAWLQGLGFGQPAVDRVRVDVGYVTRCYRLPPDCLDGDLACIHGPAPDRPHGGALARLEGDIWMLTLFGMLGEHPRRTLMGSARSPGRCRSPTSTRRSAPPSRSTVRPGTGSRPTSGAAPRGCASSLRASW
jgi:hypothetical protein